MMARVAGGAEPHYLQGPRVILVVSLNLACAATTWTLSQHPEPKSSSNHQVRSLSKALVRSSAVLGFLAIRDSLLQALAVPPHHLFFVRSLPAPVPSSHVEALVVATHVGATLFERLLVHVFAARDRLLTRLAVATAKTWTRRRSKSVAPTC